MFGGQQNKKAETIQITKEDLNLKSAPDQIQGSQIEQLLMTVYIVAGFVAVIAIIFGGIRYTISNGDASQITAAKNIILYAVIGLVVIISAAAITDFVINNIAK